ncbi:Hsp70 family protein [Nakamurella sp. YIM 132087]|uniref:Hsp70 family protein n=1 Tax=Nakamurella alba TaxID=2665158 RepID=A0A7K1FQY7_9ACTN|nr:Hsp70 family protein [Nakamurella alba]MTD16558.1 Hsp70 family protein [Nakamurella alba]
MDVLGLDFGTSNTVAVLRSEGREPRVLSIDGSGWMPSCVYVDDDGSLAVGRDAERKARLAPERFEANPKRRIDDGEMLLGVRVVPVVDAIAAVLARVAEEARRQLNGRSPDEVHLTHPAQWGSARQNVLLAAARAAGLGPEIVLMPEPVAAAAHFASLPGKSLPEGASLAVYDLGGGTFDVAVVTSTPTGFSVLAEAGLPDVGGIDFDQAVVDHLGSRLSAADPARWQAIMRPRTAADRRAARTLREDVRAAKETLSRYAQTDLTLPEPFEDTLLTRREFDGLIRPVVARTVDLVATTVARAGLDPARLAGVYLVGGSSRIPLVATMITERLGVVATTLDQPETSVAMGAALAPAGSRPQTRTAFVPGAPEIPGRPSATGSVPAAPPSMPQSGQPQPAQPQPAQPQPGQSQSGQPQSGQRPPAAAGPAVPSAPPAQQGFAPAAAPYPAAGGYQPPAAPVQQPAWSAAPPSGPMPSAPFSGGPPAYVPGHPGQGGGDGGAAARKRRMQLLIAAAVVVVLGVVTTVILLNRSSGNEAGGGGTGPGTTGPALPPVTTGPGTTGPVGPTSPPVTTDPPVTSPAAGDCGEPDSRGITACMTATTGQLFGAMSCTKDLSGFEDQDQARQVEALLTTYTLCRESSDTFGLVSMQADNMADLQAAAGVVTQNATQVGSGTWSTENGEQGNYIYATLEGEGIVYWDGGAATPVINFMTATTGTQSTAESMFEAWKQLFPATLG